MLAEVADGQGAEIIVATHNQVCAPACAACTGAGAYDQRRPVRSACIELS